jgi:hypothetical protein
MVWSLSKMIRIENAANSISINDLKALMQLYDINGKQAADLEALAREARKRSWWWGENYSVAPKTLLQLIDLESAASSIRQFETMFVPGILQTEDYARAVLQIFYEEKPAAELVELRTKREDLLRRENAPKFSFILDEPVIQRLAGGPAVMRQQLQHLIRVADLQNVTIRVVPFTAGFHPGTKGPFEVIKLADADDEYAVFIETVRGDVIWDKPEQTQPYLEAFDRVEEKSLSPSQSVDLLRAIAKGLA